VVETYFLITFFIFGSAPMRLRLPLLLASLALAAPAVAEAQAPPSTSIVVEGVKDRAKRISNFVRDLTPSNQSYNQLSRWEVPVCPAVFGLTAPQRAFVVDRMRSIAAAADVPLAKPGCDPNVIVIVTSNKAALLAGLEKRHADYFPADWSNRKVHELEQDTYPVAGWQFEGLLSTDGLRLADSTSAFDPVDPAGLVAATIPTTAPASRLRPPGRRDVLTSILIVQANALTGLTETQFADYAAMRAFVRTDPRTVRASPADTILKVLDAPMGTAVPLSLTNFDLSFLKAFYASGTESYAGAQRSDIAWRMKRDLDRQAAQH
jgi:hypothetical protein